MRFEIIYPFIQIYLGQHCPSNSTDITKIAIHLYTKIHNHMKKALRGDANTALWL